MKGRSVKALYPKPVKYSHQIESISVVIRSVTIILQEEEILA